MRNYDMANSASEQYDKNPVYVLIDSRASKQAGRTARAGFACLSR